MAARTRITRRVVVASTIAAVANSALATSVVAGTSPDAETGEQARPPGDQVERLARALSAELAAQSGGKFGIVVRPAGYVDEPVAVIDLAEAHDAAYSLSGGLVQAVCAHVAAYSALGHASRAADAVRLGRKPTADELARFDRASDEADATLMALCRYPARNGPERQTKARHLLGFVSDVTIRPQHVVALLHAQLIEDGDGPLQARTIRFEAITSRESS